MRNRKKTQQDNKLCFSQIDVDMIVIVALSAYEHKAQYLHMCKLSCEIGQEDGGRESMVAKVRDPEALKRKPLWSRSRLLRLVIGFVRSLKVHFLLNRQKVDVRVYVYQHVSIVGGRGHGILY